MGDWESAIICPHCNHKFTDSWEYNDCSGGKKVQCEDCDKYFQLEVDFDVTYSTAKLKEQEGE